MANWGIGIGAFADGVLRGMEIGRQYKAAKKEYDLQKARDEALDEAKNERESAIEADTARIMGLGPQGPEAPGAPSQEPVPVAPVTQPVDMSSPQPRPVDSPPPAAEPQATATPAQQVPRPGTPALADSKPLSITGQQPDQKPVAARGLGQPSMTREEARKLAEKKAPSVMEFFQTKAVPRIAEAYLRQGDIDKAEAWTKWAEQAETKRNLGTWAKAWRATQLGDFEGAADHFFELYKRLDDGVTPISKEVVKDKDGNVTGFNVKLRDDATGEERSSFIDRNQMIDMGLAALSPPQLFEATWQRQQALEKAKLSAAAEAGKIQMQTAKDIAVEQVRQGGREKLEDVKHGNKMLQIDRQGEVSAQNQRNKVQQELDAKIGALEKAGYSKEFIRDALPQILGVDQYKRATSPEEARRLAFSDRMKNDPSFARMSEDRQRQIIERDMSLIYGGVKPTAAPGAQQSSAPAAAPNPAARGLPVLDKKTGKIIYMGAQ